MSRLMQLVAFTVLSVFVVPGVLAGTQEGTDITPVPLQRVETTPDRIVPGDEIDQLEAKLKPEARFSDYVPRWRVETRTFAFAHYKKTKSSTFTIILDGDKVVGVMCSGDIMVVARTPDDASTKVNMPTERLHLDNLLGPSFPIYQFIQKAKTHGSIHRDIEDSTAGEWWEVGDRHLDFVRKQQHEKYDIEARFRFTVDPIYGYRIDGIRDMTWKVNPKGTTFNGGSFTPGCYVPWEYAATYDRTVWTPISGKLEGWANNLVCMDRCDANKKAFAWRDGGFIAYLPDRDGWSPVFTRKDGTGDTPSLSLCNAHNDFHIKFQIKDLPAVGKTYPFRFVHRHMALPPEMTAHLWNNVELIQSKASAIVIRLGETEDFEKQPVPLTEPARGLIWTSGGPKVAEGVARSGNQSITFTGRAWPNLPQISLQPNTKYRLEGWYKVEPWSDEQWEAAKKKDASRREKLTKRGKKLPAEVDWEAAKRDAKAYITADFYEWSPHTGEMVKKMRTNAATPDKDGWQHVVLDIDSPAWGPALNVTFHADYCNVWLDDFALRIDEQRRPRSAASTSR